MRKAAYQRFWKEEEGCFVSNGQISEASQIWMVLADVVEPEKAEKAMRKALTLQEGPGIQTPYLHHYYVMALLRSGLREEAVTHLKEYWGGMLDAIPLALLGAFVFHWHVLAVYACTCLDEVGKIPWVMMHFRKYKWVQDLTRQT